MIDARFRPMPKWTRKPALQYERSQFKAKYADTLNALEYELAKLSARDIIIEAGYKMEDIRNDGWPYSGTKPLHPGVVLYFSSGKRSMEFPCGTYGTFQSNMRAIALTLENLRAIDRYGVTQGHQQYIGFAMIEAPGAMSDPEKVIRTLAGPANADIPPPSLKDAYRQAARIHNPDMGGDREKWELLQRAWGMLRPAAGAS